MRRLPGANVARAIRHRERTLKKISLMFAAVLALSTAALAQTSTPPSGDMKADREQMKADREQMKADREKMKADRAKMKADREQKRAERKAARDAAKGGNAPSQSQ